MSLPTRRGFRFLLVLLAIAATAVAPAASAQVGNRPKMKRANEMIRRQEPARVSARLMGRINPENSRVVVSISRQRAYLMLGDEIAIDTPVSTGKAAGMTPAGKFTVSEKDKDHRSSLYGDFVDRRGRTVRSGVSMHIDSAPSGTRFNGAPMRYFCRFNGAIGMHVGILPGYPASHGCVRLPSDIAPLIYEKVKVGTPVEVMP
jgi:lipoprotein-anchoring transpeptidase ErfK/SrfK